MPGFGKSDLFRFKLNITNKTIQRDKIPNDMSGCDEADMQVNEVMEVYQNGNRYDSMFHGVHDFEFLISEIRKSGDPVLELCCGTGRLLMPLLAEGIYCAGIDYSKEMIAVAEEKLSSEGYVADLHVVDASSFKLDKKFRTIFIGNNSIGHFTTLNQVISMLGCVADHLAMDGRFIIDVFVPAIKQLAVIDNEQLQFKYIDTDSGETIEVWEEYSYDTSSQVKTARWRSVINGKTVKTEVFYIKMFFPQELDALLKMTGFEILEKYGDYDYSQFANGCPKQLVICKRTD